MLCFPGSRGSDLLYFQDLDKSCRHRSWILKLQESLTPFWLWGRGKSAVTLPCLPSTALPGRGAQHRVRSSRGQKAADTHKCTRWGYSHMVSQIWPSVGIFCAPDWWKGSSLSPHQLLPCRGRVVQNHCQTDLMAGRESRGLGGGSASLSPSLCDHKPPRHKIPFKQQWSSVLELVFFFTFTSLPRGLIWCLVLLMAGNLRISSLSLSVTHLYPFVPVPTLVCSLNSSPHSPVLTLLPPAFIDSNHISQSQIKAAFAALLCSWSYFNTPFLRLCARTDYLVFQARSPGPGSRTAGVTSFCIISEDEPHFTEVTQGMIPMRTVNSHENHKCN